MAITDSAKKALRNSKRKQIFNLARKDQFKGAVKKLERLIKDKKIAEAKAFFPLVQKAIDKAAKTNLLKDNTAGRKKSRLVALLKRSS